MIMFCANCFKIRIIIGDSGNIFNIDTDRVIKEINSGKSEFQLNPTIIEADPFLFVYNDCLYLFYERQKMREPGMIMMTKTNDLKTWSEPIVVLKESHHLSFPFVFEEKGQIYMIPETSEDNNVKIYEATNFELTNFKLKKVLLEQPHSKDIITNYVDSSIYKKNGIFYLWTSVEYRQGYSLELYTSESLLGTYKKHPSSPICTSNKYGRNAGSIFLWNDNLYRPSQDCSNTYGENLQISKIDVLSEQDYSESLIIDNIYKSNNSFYKDGGHHFNIVKFHGKTIISTDAKEYHYLFFARIMKHFK